VSSQSSKSNPVANRYASAFVDMAGDAKLLDKIEQDMRDLFAMIEGSPDLQRVIFNPLASREQQLNVIVALADKAKFQKLTRSFLGVLAQNRRLPQVTAVITAIFAELSRRRGEIAAQVQTAHALSPAQTASLQAELAKAMGSHVTLNVEVNKDLIGGMVVTVGSRMIDDSVRTKLEKLKRAMNSNENVQAKGATS